MKNLTQIEKEFDKNYYRLDLHTPEEIKSFYRRVLTELLEGLVPDEAIAGRTWRQGEFETVAVAETKGWNDCRSALLQKIQEIKGEI